MRIVRFIILLFLVAEQLPACQNPVPMQYGNPPVWVKDNYNVPESESKTALVRVYSGFGNTRDAAKDDAKTEAIRNARARYGIDCSIVNGNVSCGGNIVATYWIEAEWLGRCGIDEYVAYLLIQQDSYGKEFIPLKKSKTYEYTNKEKEEHKRLKLEWEKKSTKAVELTKPPKQSYFSTYSGNLTNGTRWGTWATNTIFPGIGSILFMDDFSGAMIQWVLFGGGLAFTLNEFYYVGIPVLALDVFYNVYRSATYEKVSGTTISAGDRTISLILNLIPGAGYAFTGLQDYGDGGTAGIVLAAIFGLVGYGVLITGIVYPFVPEHETEYRLGCIIPGGIFSALHIAVSVYHASTYDNNRYTNSGGGFNLAVLPNSRGNLMPYLMYNKAF
ncbi:MAG: hypothetical protein FWC26_11045 [Fibromonadales bacterium]|nr:hypothetical protein [Fibromonadales bacterium]